MYQKIQKKGSSNNYSRSIQKGSGYIGGNGNRNDNGKSIMKKQGQRQEFIYGGALDEWSLEDKKDIRELNKQTTWKRNPNGNFTLYKDRQYTKEGTPYFPGTIIPINSQCLTQTLSDTGYAFTCDPLLNLFNSNDSIDYHYAIAAHTYIIHLSVRNDSVGNLISMSKIVNPKWALKILTRYGFKKYRSMENVCGFRPILKIESVKSWIRRLIRNRCGEPELFNIGSNVDPNCNDDENANKSFTTILGAENVSNILNIYNKVHCELRAPTVPAITKYNENQRTNYIEVNNMVTQATNNTNAIFNNNDSKGLNKPLFHVLEILSEWVNANPQALNPTLYPPGQECGQIRREIPTTINENYGNPSDKYNVYTNISKEEKVKQMIGISRNYVCGLENLRKAINSDITNPQIYMRNMIKYPLKMNFDRQAFNNIGFMNYGVGFDSQNFYPGLGGTPADILKFTGSFNGNLINPTYNTGISQFSIQGQINPRLQQQFPVQNNDIYNQGYVYGGNNNINGGGETRTEAELLKLRQSYCSGLYRDIYEDIKRGMNYLGSAISEKTDNEFQTLLAIQEQNERDIINQIKEFIERLRLIQQLPGKNNVEGMSNDELKDLIREYRPVLDERQSEYRKYANAIITQLMKYANMYFNTAFDEYNSMYNREPIYGGCCSPMGDIVVSNPPSDWQTNVFVKGGGKGNNRNNPISGGAKDVIPIMETDKLAASNLEFLRYYGIGSTDPSLISQQTQLQRTQQQLVQNPLQQYQQPQIQNPLQQAQQQLVQRQSQASNLQKQFLVSSTDVPKTQMNVTTPYKAFNNSFNNYILQFQEFMNVFDQVFANIIPDQKRNMELWMFIVPLMYNGVITTADADLFRSIVVGGHGDAIFGGHGGLIYGSGEGEYLLTFSPEEFAELMQGEAIERSRLERLLRRGQAHEQIGEWRAQHSQLQPIQPQQPIQQPQQQQQPIPQQPQPLQSPLQPQQQPLQSPLQPQQQQQQQPLQSPLQPQQQQPQQPLQPQQQQQPTQPQQPTQQQEPQELQSPTWGQWFSGLGTSAMGYAAANPSLYTLGYGGLGLGVIGSVYWLASHGYLGKTGQKVAGYTKEATKSVASTVGRIAIPTALGTVAYTTITGTTGSPYLGVLGSTVAGSVGTGINNLISSAWNALPGTKSTVDTSSATSSTTSITNAINRATTPMEMISVIKGTEFSDFIASINSSFANIESAQRSQCSSNCERAYNIHVNTLLFAYSIIEEIKIIAAKKIYNNVLASSTSANRLGILMYENPLIAINAISQINDIVKRLERYITSSQKFNDMTSERNVITNLRNNISKTIDNFKLLSQTSIALFLCMQQNSQCNEFITYIANILNSDPSIANAIYQCGITIKGTEKITSNWTKYFTSPTDIPSAFSITEIDNNYIIGDNAVNQGVAKGISLGQITPQQIKGGSHELESENPIDFIAFDPFREDDKILFPKLTHQIETLEGERELENIKKLTELIKLNSPKITPKCIKGFIKEVTNGKIPVISSREDLEKFWYARKKILQEKLLRLNLDEQKQRELLRQFDKFAAKSIESLSKFLQLNEEEQCEKIHEKLFGYLHTNKPTRTEEELIYGGANFKGPWYALDEFKIDNNLINTLVAKNGYMFRNGKLLSRILQDILTLSTLTNGQNRIFPVKDMADIIKRTNKNFTYMSIQSVDDMIKFMDKLLLSLIGSLCILLLISIACFVKVNNLVTKDLTSNNDVMTLIYSHLTTAKLDTFFTALSKGGLKETEQQRGWFIITRTDTNNILLLVGSIMSNANNFTFDDDSKRFLEAFGPTVQYIIDFSKDVNGIAFPKRENIIRQSIYADNIQHVNTLENVREKMSIPLTGGNNNGNRNNNGNNRSKRVSFE